MDIDLTVVVPGHPFNAVGKNGVWPGYY